nr:hypothetical protein [Aquicoccus sp. G2-2]MEA1113865.1 hypothetical protein [Aquicoccus sp. G2-2]
MLRVFRIQVVFQLKLETLQGYPFRAVDASKERETNRRRGIVVAREYRL